MRFSSVCSIVVLVAACNEAPTAGRGVAPDLSTPEGAAKCQVAAVQARSLEGWLACIHPDGRAEFRAELQEEIERDPGFWADAAEKLAPLAPVKGDDFTVSPMKPGQERWGDRMASYRFSDRGKIELA